MADDLTGITGIGAATAKALADEGVASFAALAQLSAEEAERLRVRPEWIAQANELSSKIPAGSPDPNERVAGPEGEPPASGIAGPTPGAVASAPGPSSTDAPREQKADGGAGNPAGAPAGEAAVLVVIGPRRGRWRAGMRFGQEPQVLPIDALTADEIAAIEGDPALTVQRTTAPRKGGG